MSDHFTVRHLGKEDRTGFDCGDEALNHYFQTQVSQDIRRRAAGCFIAISESSGDIAGFYTISACHTNLNALPDSWRKKIARYPRVPTVLVGRLAIDVNFQGQKLGSALIVDAARRASRSELAVSLLAVEAKNEKAAQFYVHHGFQRDPDNADSLFIPLKMLL